jgi:hypothetical protein
MKKIYEKDNKKEAIHYFQLNKNTASSGMMLASFIRLEISVH